MTTENQTETREHSLEVLTDCRIYMKFVKFENADGGYFIGNCNINLGLRGTAIRFIPPEDDEESGAEIAIVNDIYTEDEFRDFINNDSNPSYFVGSCNMDINAMHTVFRFFPKRFNDENVLIISRTQKRTEGQKIENPLEVKVFMRKQATPL